MKIVNKILNVISLTFEALYYITQGINLAMAAALLVILILRL